MDKVSQWASELAEWLADAAYIERTYQDDIRREMEEWALKLLPTEGVVVPRELLETAIDACEVAEAAAIEEAFACAKAGLSVAELRNYLRADEYGAAIDKLTALEGRQK